MRYLGIDYGSKRVGLALSDEAGTMGFPHSIVPNSPRLEANLVALIQKEQIGAVVIGESRDFAGKENTIASAAHTLGLSLATHAGVEVFYEDETLTSAQARRQHESGEKSRAPQTHAHVDDSAAALILTNYLSRHHG